MGKHMRKSAWVRWAKADDGATAVEFTFMAVPFSLILLGMIEMALMFTAGTILQGATEDAARMVRTGQVQMAANPKQAFEDRLCQDASVFIPCADIKYEVIAMPDNDFFEAADYEPVFDDDGNLQPRPFGPPAQNGVTLVRVSYRYPLLTPVFATWMADTPDSRKMLMATVIMQNEPYRF